VTGAALTYALVIPKFCHANIAHRDQTAWLGRQDSNLCIRMTAAEPDQLPHRDAQVRVLHSSRSMEDDHIHRCLAA
jgi:hypothetical protein